MDSEKYERGKEIRIEVLGKEYVERKTGETDPHAQVWQDFGTELVWGSIWARPGLSRKMRSMLNICMLAMIGQLSELKLYVRAALDLGVTRDEIVEILLQVTVYGGAPKGNQAFAAAVEVFKAIDAGADPAAE